MNDIQIVIPSYRRPDILTNQTLATLVKHGSDLKNVTVFVADSEEKSIYDAQIHACGLSVKTVVGVKGLIDQRIFYNRYFEKGTPLLNLDDDIAGLYQKGENNKLEPLQGSIDSLAESGFGLCKKYGAKLWGINPVMNGLFLKPTITVGLRYICGIFHGSFAGDPCILGEERLRVTSGEDYENTLRHFVTYRKVIRFDGVCPKTKYFAKGGIEAEIGGDSKVRQRDHEDKLKQIAMRYPNLCRLTKKAGGVLNIRCKNITITKEAFLP